MSSRDHVATLAHADFVERYRRGVLKANLDRALTMHVCDRSKRLPAAVRAAHQSWKMIAFLLVIGGLISLFRVPLLWGLGASVFGVLMAPAVQNSAAEFVLEQALEDPDSYNGMVMGGVLCVVDNSRA